tara:strand:- start:3197 stop:3895 length:699 start_codon:yes stop_codon:yes gene_type:complete
MKVTHLIPASGRATRLGGIPKFLLPVPKEDNLLSHHLSISQNNIDISEVRISTNTSFSKILYNMNLEESFDKLSKVDTYNTNTMNETLLNMRNFNSEMHLVTMPDTYITDQKLIKEMIKLFKNNDELDGVIGLWNILEKQREKTGQCLVEKNLVTDVVDKNKNIKYDYLWGVVLFNNKLWEFIKKEEQHIGYSLGPAIKNDLKFGCVVAGGRYFDCGTLDEYWELVREINSA